MSWKDIKIGKKLYIGFGLVLALTLLVGWVGFSGLSTLEKEYTKADGAMEIEISVKDLAVARRDFTIVADPKTAERCVELLDKIDGQIEALKGIVDTDEMPKVEAIENFSDEYAEIFKDWIKVRSSAAELVAKIDKAEEQARDIIRYGNATRFLANLQDVRVPLKDYLLKHDEARVNTALDRLNDLIRESNGTSGNLAMALNTMKNELQAYQSNRKDIVAANEKLVPLAAKFVESTVTAEEHFDAGAQSAQSAATTLALIIVFAALAIGAGVAFVIAKAISRPLAEITRVANDVAVGDVQHDIHIQQKDEIGVLANSFRDLIDYMKNLAGAATQIAANNLTVQVEPKSDKDALGVAFKTMTNNLSNMIKELTDNATQLVSASTEIASSSEQMARGSSEQTSQTAQVSSAVEEMTATIVESSKNAGEASTMAREAASAATEGTKVVSQTIEGMNKIAKVVQDSANTIQALAKSSDQIGEIIGVIDDIADQTNLLALNAAIEAARAGEQGRGFAVVADEVRKLAERTTKATKEITDMIKGIQADTKGAVVSMEQGIHEVDGGRQLADRAGESLNAILGFSQRVQDMIQQIASAAEQQSAASEQIARNVESIANVTKENAAGIEQSASAAEQLNRQAEGLQIMVGKFQVRK
ncbi:MAG: HAMP domain-containing protein [bacterium]|nr:HAMP domain-containing protein [bacterium]